MSWLGQRPGMSPERWRPRYVSSGESSTRRRNRPPLEREPPTGARPQITLTSGRRSFNPLFRPIDPPSWGEWRPKGNGDIADLGKLRQERAKVGNHSLINLMTNLRLSEQHARACAFEDVPRMARDTNRDRLVGPSVDDCDWR